MTQDTTPTERAQPAACEHRVIVTFGGGEPDIPRIWACSECRVRFYPACPTCVDVGHRNVVHPLDAERAARAEPGRGPEWAAVLADLNEHPCEVIHGGRPKGFTCLDYQREAASGAGRYGNEWRVTVASGQRLCFRCKLRAALEAHGEPQADWWANPNRAERMRTAAPHGDFFVGSGLCKDCRKPWPCPESAEPLAHGEPQEGKR
jgi:hypothetical protein